MNRKIDYPKGWLTWDTDKRIGLEGHDEKVDSLFIEIVSHAN